MDKDKVRWNEVDANKDGQLSKVRSAWNSRFMFGIQWLFKYAVVSKSWYEMAQRVF